jgi:hypothetical protein
MLCSVAVGYQHFRDPCFLDLQCEVTDKNLGRTVIDVGLECNWLADAASQ